MTLRMVHSMRDVVLFVSPDVMWALIDTAPR